MSELTPYQRVMAREAAERHRCVPTDVRHPPGVIVPGDKLLTENIKDPNYAPYCSPCVPFRRLRRIDEGFICPGCGNKHNWDLTKFNGNKDVEVAEGYPPLSAWRSNVKAPDKPVLSIKQWNENVEARKQQRLNHKLNK